MLRSRYCESATWQHHAQPRDLGGTLIVKLCLNRSFIPASVSWSKTRRKRPAELSWSVWLRRCNQLSIKWRAFFAHQTSFLPLLGFCSSVRHCRYLTIFNLWCSGILHPCFWKHELMYSWRIWLHRLCLTSELSYFSSFSGRSSNTRF